MTLKLELAARENVIKESTVDFEIATTSTSWLYTL